MNTKRKISSRTSRHTRPGVEDAARLVDLVSSESWEVASSNYDAMLLAKGGDRLVELDQQREKLASKWRLNSESSMDASMTKEQLLDIIIEWKFLKGKPRNALKPLLHSNTDASVIAASKLAFEAANAIPKFGDKENQKDNIDHVKNEDSTQQHIVSAITHLCKLKGVGPATASAILCLLRPDMFAFMDDEVIECLLPNKKRGYTLGIYMEINNRCRQIADQLSNNNAVQRSKKKRKMNSDGKESDNGSSSFGKWTNCEVGKALWACAMLSATNNKDGLSSVFKTK